MKRNNWQLTGYFSAVLQKDSSSLMDENSGGQYMRMQQAIKKILIFTSILFMMVFAVFPVRAEEPDTETDPESEVTEELSKEEQDPQQEDPAQEEDPPEPEIIHESYEMKVNDTLVLESHDLNWSSESECVGFDTKEDKLEVKALTDGTAILKGSDLEGTLRAEYEITVTRPAPEGVWRYNGGWWYQYPDGSYPVNCWKQIDGEWYHFSGSGYMNTGWQHINGQWYLFASSGEMRTGWVYQNAWYYLKPTGEMATGWNLIDEEWYYFNSNGTMKTGWQWISGFWYLFGSDGAMQTGWINQNGIFYYLRPTGEMARGWEMLEDNWYYFDSSGIMHTGWLKTYNGWYYLLSSGIMVTGEQIIDGKNYYFFDNGLLRDAAYMLRSAPGGATVSGFGGYVPCDSINNLISQSLYGIQHDGYGIGFIMVDINTGMGVTYNADQIFYAASASKGPYIASLLEHDHNIAGVSRDEILNVLTTSSDYSYEILFHTYGLSYIHDWVNQLSLRGDVYGTSGYIYCSARELALLWTKCYDFFSADSYGAGIASWYYHPNNSPIHEVLWNLYYTCSKAGWIGEPDYVSSTDAGIVYSYSGPYIIAIISNMPSQNSRLTDLVYALEAAHNDMFQ